MTERYRDAGVDIEAGEEVVRRIKNSVASTRVPGVMGGFGGFGGLFDLAAADVGDDPILVSGTDGVGTKLKLAFMMDRHDTVGVDCVAMCVNDILTLGAKPLFFLDYVAVGKLQPEVVEAIVSGIADGCRQSGCALLGGETAELPGFYQAGEYDLAGFAVGVVSRSKIVDGSRIEAGDVIVGLPSNGVHSNGFSLVRSVLVQGKPESLGSTDARLGHSFGEELLVPTRIYVPEVLSVLSEDIDVRGMVHVTGGGITGNLPRPLPDGLGAVLDQDALDSAVLPVFQVIRERGEVSWKEMYAVFNMGVGYVLVVPPQDAERTLDTLGSEAVRLGHISTWDGTGDRVNIPRFSA